MWYTATVFENFRNGVNSVYNVMLGNQSDSSDEDEEDTIFAKGKYEKREDYDEEDRTSNLQTFWNIFNANQGVVILTMPFVVLCGGYLSLVATAVVAMVSNYTSKKLIRCLYETDPETGVHRRVRDSYEEIGEAFADDFGKWMVYVAMIVEQLSYCTLLLILCGSILHSSFPELPFNNVHWSMFAFILVIPNSFMVNLGQVAWVSLVTVIVGPIVYVIVAIYSFYHASKWTIHEAPPFDVGKFFVAMGIVVVSYSSQPYMPAIEGGMRSRKRYNIVMNVTYFAITFVKIVFGLIGYFTFKGETKQVITNNLPHGSFRTSINVLVLVLALASFTFPAYTVFVILDKIHVKNPKHWISEKLKSFSGNDSDEEILEDEKAQLINDDSECGIAEEPKPSRIKRAAVRLLLISVALTVAVLVPHFGLYMALVGSFTGMCLSFIFPCLFHMKLRHDEMQKYELFLDTAIIALGSVSAGIGMYYSTRALVDAYSDVH